MAKTSPRKPTWAFSTRSEFANEPVFTSRPAAESAPRAAGITPPLATIAIRFRAPPTATTHMKRRSRFRRMHTPASA